MRGDQQAPEPMPECGGRKDASIAFLSVLKSSDLPAEMALAKEYSGKRSFSLPLYPHYILFLGHCQPVKQSFQQHDKEKGA